MILRATNVDGTTKRCHRQALMWEQLVGESGRRLESGSPYITWSEHDETTYVYKESSGYANIRTYVSG